MRKLGFRVIEYRGKKREISWWFEHEVSDLDGLIERLELVGRSAQAFWSETPLDPEIRGILLRIKPVLSERTQLLLEDLLV